MAYNPTETEPLRHCPFCGRKPARFRGIDDLGQLAMQVICDDDLGCGATGPLSPTEAQAAHWWNQRTKSANHG